MSQLLSAVKYLTLAGVVGTTGYYSLYSVQGGHRAVKYNRFTGISDKVIDEGTHFLIPWFERAIIFDVTSKPEVVSSLTGTHDLQMVRIDLRVLAKPEVGRLPTIYRELGLDFKERILPSIIHEMLKQTVARYNASNLLTQREEVVGFVRRSLIDKAKEFHIDITDVSFLGMTFGHEFNAAVEAKQVAQQEAERAKYLVVKAEQDKKSAIIRAEGESQAAEMIGNAITDQPGFVELRKIQAARDIANTIAQSRNRVYLNSDSLLLNLLPQTLTMPKGSVVPGASNGGGFWSWFRSKGTV